MNSVVPLSDADLDRFIHIVADAYPGMKLITADDKRRFKDRMQQLGADPTINTYGLYRNDHLLGGMRLFDFVVRLLSAEVNAGGVGLVAVDLLHKKEHVAKDLISAFIQHYRERDVSLVMLYPFRPDFYKQMGFGYGTRLNTYRFHPSSLPRGGSKANVRMLGAADAEAIVACYDRAWRDTNGLIKRTPVNLVRMLSNPENRAVGVQRGDEIVAYAIWSFKPSCPDNWLLNDVHVSELIYDDATALSELLTFLHTQSDQINQIVLNVPDDYFHYVLSDPRNGSMNVVALHHETNTQGLGLMYRVIDVAGVFRDLEAHNFNGQSCCFKLTIADSFLHTNADSTIIQVEAGRARVVEHGSIDVEISLDIANFSSLLVGAVPFKQLFRYGLVEMSDPKWLNTLDALFGAERPICLTLF